MMFRFNPKQLFFLLVFSFGLTPIFAQQYFYFVGFKDKPHYENIVYTPSLYLSQKAIERRTINKIPLNPNDVPPDSAYITALAKLPLYIYGQSRWFNGCMVLVSNKNVQEQIKALPFVAAVTYLGPANYLEESEESRELPLENQLLMLEQSFENKKLKEDSILVGKSKKQLALIGSDSLLKSNIGGEGVLIAVLDAGFLNMDKLIPFRHLFNHKRIIAAWDFVEHEEEVFEDDEHGLAVMSCLAAYQPGVIMGSAPNANYLLLRTENASSEYLYEEYLWAIAAEFADSCGADIINSSLGYTKHDDRSMGHKYSDLDGKTTVVTRAAEIAASKGILVVASAGNEGNNSWRQISAPADGENVIAVGAVDSYGGYVGFSSVGPSADKRMKPDLAAMGKSITLINESGKIYEGNGTSYACPIVSGALAQLLQQAPQASSLKIRSAIELSCPNFLEPDKYLGAGIPDLLLASKMVTAIDDSLIDVRLSSDQKEILITLHSRSKQQVSFNLNHSILGEQANGSLTLQKGLNRLPIKLNKKRPSGIYQLGVQFKLFKSEIPISIP